MPDLHHRIHISTRLGALDLRASLELHARWTLLFGPSGSGKSTILRAACGLLGAEGIRVDRLEPNGTVIPLQQIAPHLRQIRCAPQRSALFPHLTVAENVAYAAGSNPTSEILELFRLRPIARRYPRDLSGGERQRVNLARAFASPNGRLMLLDEPFAGIDRALRDELLPEMRLWLSSRKIPVLSVSHDVEEALQLDAHVILLREGRIEAEGPASEALAPERHRLLQTLTATL